jgi:PAS domain S-box-containing protein
VNALLGSEAVLVELLVVGPLIAATRATVMDTVVVSVVALMAAIPLGLASDAFLDTAHVGGAAAVAIGGLLSVIIARLRSGRERDAAELSVQYGVARVLGESDTTDAAGTRMLEAIAAPLGWRAGHLWEPDDDGELVCTAAWVDDGPELTEFEKVTHELRARPGRGLPGRVWQSLQPDWVSDLSTDPNFLRRESAAAEGLACGLAFPVLSAERPLAVIELFSDEHRELDHQMVALTDALGTQIGEFIERVRATRTMRESENRARQSRDQLEAMLRGVADAVTVQAPDGHLLFVNDAAATTLGFESTTALLECAPADILARFEIFDPEGRPFPVSELPGRRALAGEEGAEAVVRFRETETGEERWANIKATPILDGGGEVEMAINVIEDITAHKRAELAQRFLSRTSEVLSHWLDSEEVLEQVAGLAVPELADWCAVDLVTPTGELERVVLTHADPGRREQALELSRRYPPDPEVSLVYRVMRNAVPVFYTEITEEMLRASARDEEQYELLRELGMRSAVMVPMSGRDRTLGVLTLVTGTSGRRFDATDLALAEELAHRCATALDNGRLYRERSYIARTLQRSLLPVELPDMPGIEAAARFRPIGEGNEVGGDFYDMFESGRRGWAVVMGDVCGKGPDAAAVTALARYTLRAAAVRERLPSRGLRLLNEALLRQRDDRRFCTVAYAYLEVMEEGARLGFASGGHPLPLVVRADGAVEQVGTAGTLLGVVDDPDFDDRALTLSRGDVIVFYTDGVIESRPPGTPFDEARLAELLSTCAGQDADSVAAKVEQAALSSQGGQVRDDIAVLVLRVAR